MDDVKDIGEISTENSDMKDYESLLLMKHELSQLPLKTLKNVYSDMENYMWFLDTFALLTQVDGGFLLMSKDYYDRILDIVDIHRFDVKDEARQLANDVIYYVNLAKSEFGSSLNRRLLLQYKEYQEDLREVDFDTIRDLMDSISFDAIVWTALVHDKMDLIDNEDYYLYSVNYIAKTFPELFYNDEIKNRAVNGLNIIHDNQSIFGRKKKQFIDEIANNIQKIKKNDESK